MYTEDEQRVTRLEELLVEFTAQNMAFQRAMQASAERTEKSFNKLHLELVEFKNEIRLDTQKFKDHVEADTQTLKREMQTFKDELRSDTQTLKWEMQTFKDEMHQDRRNMNKQWGELANKMGTVVEDIIAPAVRPAIEQYFKEEVTYRAVNVRKKDTASNLRGEFDVVATTKSFVVLVETKTSPRPNNLTELLDEIVPRFRSLFPEYEHLTMIPVMAGLRFEDSFLPLATEAGVYLLAYREWDYMDLLNFDAIQSKAAQQPEL